MLNLLSGPVFMNLSQGLDVAALRQRVHANNLANVNTPHFKRSVVEFTDILKNVTAGESGLAVTNAGHIGAEAFGNSGGARVLKDQSTSMRSDGNNVDVDREMSELAINQLYYNALSQQANDRIGLLRYVINEGRR